jgi:hypothetical protein
MFTVGVSVRSSLLLQAKVCAKLNFQLSSLEYENDTGLIGRHVEEFHTNTWGVARSARVLNDGSCLPETRICIQEIKHSGLTSQSKVTGHNTLVVRTLQLLHGAYVSI